MHTVRSVAGRPHDRELRLAAKQALKHPPVRFTGAQALAIGNGFGEFVARSGLTVWACSILPAHAHLVVAPHRYSVEQVANLLKGAATRRLLEDGLHPFGRDAKGRVIKCWARDEWPVFLDSVDDVLRSIKYVRDNPLKEGKRRQRWHFVTPYRPQAA